MLTLFSNFFPEPETCMRVWDNFLLEGTVFAIKTSLGILKYFEIELKMSTFDDAVKIIKRRPKEINESLLF